MARLAHNDYLQQASDSGVPGFILYSGFIVGALASSYPRITRLPLESNKAHVPKQETPRKPTRTEAEGPLDSQRQNQLWFSLWLGALGFSLQSLMEFSLYI